MPQTLNFFSRKIFAIWCFKLTLCDLSEFTVWNRSTTLGRKDIGVRESESLSKNKFLSCLQPENFGFLIFLYLIKTSGARRSQSRTIISHKFDLLVNCLFYSEIILFREFFCQILFYAILILGTLTRIHVMLNTL